MTEYIVKEKDKMGKIFLNKEAIDSDSLKQIRSMIRHESIHNARVMPDCHKSMGCCVGFTSKIIDKIVPNFVGGDIGCGITTYPIIDFKESKLKQFDKFIRDNVPFNFHGKPSQLKQTFFDDALERIYYLSNLGGCPFTTMRAETGTLAGDYRQAGWICHAHASSEALIFCFYSRADWIPHIRNGY